ncbi:hypothetical protein C8Q80DRAFT_1118517 [Daedaleopsis nitida]|nr:hypothetical protein C8Q80DRAFT_1118517 [Daedaleopsis nitida]
MSLSTTNKSKKPLWATGDGLPGESPVHGSSDADTTFGSALSPVSADGETVTTPRSVGARPLSVAVPSRPPSARPLVLEEKPAVVKTEETGRAAAVLARQPPAAVKAHARFVDNDPENLFDDRNASAKTTSAETSAGCNASTTGTRPMSVEKDEGGWYTSVRGRHNPPRSGSPRNSSDSELHAEGASDLKTFLKGKAIDARNWGTAGVPDEDLDPELQRQAFSSYAAGKAMMDNASEQGQGGSTSKQAPVTGQTTVVPTASDISNEIDLIRAKLESLKLASSGSSPVLGAPQAQPCIFAP